MMQPMQKSKWTQIFILTIFFVVGLLTILFILDYHYPILSPLSASSQPSIRRYGTVESVDYNNKILIISFSNPFARDEKIVIKSHISKDTIIKTAIVFTDSQGIVYGIGKNTYSSLKNINPGHMIQTESVINNNRYEAVYILHGDTLIKTWIKT